MFMFSILSSIWERSLKAIHHNDDLVVNIVAAAAAILELQGCPADDIGLAKAGGILHQQQVNIFVIGVGLALIQQFFFEPSETPFNWRSSIFSK